VTFSDAAAIKTIDLATTVHPGKMTFTNTGNTNDYIVTGAGGLVIEEHRIPGVLLISGDRHGARGFRIPRPSGYEFYEFETASLGGRSGPPVTNPKWTTQLYGFANKFAFGEFTFDISKDDPTVTYRLVEFTGVILYELELSRSQLTPREK
jgi:alkaline phosphatase D